MAWFTFAHGNIPLEVKKRFKDEFSEQSSGKRWMLATGGPQELLHTTHLSDGSRSLIAGLPLAESGGTIFDNEQAVTRLLKGPAASSTPPDGHYAVLHWDENRAEFYNDSLGIRRVFFSNADDYIVVSTRLDHLGVLLGNTVLNPPALGAYWLMNCPAAFNVPLKNISRLGPGGRASWEHGALKREHYPLCLDLHNTSSDEEFLHRLYEIVNSPPPKDFNWSLGLSGGFDSRLLLSVFNEKNRLALRTHTFGPAGQPDTVIAERAALAAGIPHMAIQNNTSSAEAILKLLTSFIGQSLLQTSASDLLNWQHYQMLYKEKRAVIDGAYGEIYRRMLLNRLLGFSRRAIRNKDGAALAQAITAYRPDVFTEEVHSQMVEGAQTEAAAIFGRMPDPAETGYENWADLFYTAFKLPHYNGFGQSALDSFSISFMPFIQPSLLQTGLRLPLRRRKNSKLFREFIRDEFPELTAIPLVKDNITVPYALSHSAAWAYRKAASMFGVAYGNRDREMMLHTLKPFIMDTLSSIQRGNDILRTREIRMKAEEYFDGKHQHESLLDWWLTVHIWLNAVKAL